VKLIRIMIFGAALLAAVGIIVAVGRHDRRALKESLPPPSRSIILPTKPGTYFGVYATHVPDSYAGVSAFATVTGVRPRLAVYYSGWREPFRTAFAATAAKDGVVPLVQIEPTRVSLVAIASGRYDAYLSSYAESVRAYPHPVILSVGHEMNGSWYSWGYRHASPSAFVAAWRHIVSVFRAAGANNVTWLWTVNIVHDSQNRRIPRPGPWWPGSSYVTWVGIDGYYYNSSRKFAPLFGPTIAAVREFTRDPILIAETAVAPAAGQPEKISDLFGGIRSYGLLGFVWFDAPGSQDWRLSSPAAIAAFRRDAQKFEKPTS